jgi:putative membrane protein
MLGQGAEDFLGTQGDPWDTQSDMFFALLGAISALLFFSRWHQAQLQLKEQVEHTATNSH